MKTIKLWSKKEVLDFKKRWHAITIPVNIQIKNKQITLDLKRVERIIMAGDRIALGDCACRSTLNNCDFPLNTCKELNGLRRKKQLLLLLIHTIKDWFISLSIRRRILLNYLLRFVAAVLVAVVLFRD
jgi:hypothetical protein